MNTLRLGDVIAYSPERHHCHEGTAVVRRRADGTLYLQDTFWGMSDDKVVRPNQFRVMFNLDDYEQFDRGRSGWERYRNEDRAVITHQHGLQSTFYLRKGATEDRETIIENAWGELEKAERKLSDAIWHRDSCQRLLDHLLAEQVTS